MSPRPREALRVTVLLAIIFASGCMGFLGIGHPYPTHHHVSVSAGETETIAMELQNVSRLVVVVSAPESVTSCSVQFSPNPYAIRDSLPQQFLWQNGTQVTLQLTVTTKPTTIPDTYTIDVAFSDEHPTHHVYLNVVNENVEYVSPPPAEQRMETHQILCPYNVSSPDQPSQALL